MKRKIRYLAMLLMSTSMVLCSCGGGSANSSASQSASAEASAESAEDAAKKAEEEAAKKAEEEAKAAAEASRLAEEEAKKKAEEEAKAAEEALKKELEEYGIEAVEEGILVEIAAACAEEDYETAWELMYTDAYEEEANSLEASGKDRKIAETPSGRIGLFHANGYASTYVGDFFIYFGEFKGDQREGTGVWLEVDSTSMHPEYTFRASGEWHNDLPNGIFCFDHPGMDGSRNVISGQPFKNGVKDGDETFTYTDGNGEEQEGLTKYRDGYMLIRLDDDNYFTLKEIQESYKSGSGYHLGGKVYDESWTEIIRSYEGNEGYTRRMWFFGFEPVE